MVAVKGKTSICEILSHFLAGIPMNLLRIKRRELRVMEGAVECPF
jgi:hypothetical protein